jgi:putative ATPase
MRAVTDEQKGLGSFNVVIDDDAADFLANAANGDARNALSAIELGVMTTPPGEDGKIHIDRATAAECIQKKVLPYDKDGDNHYDNISAFIKSMRGSDPDAAIYYLARMLCSGEDIKFIARRIMICASEDVGMADPQALQVAVSASLAVERVGMPEARIILAQAACYVACAPKSNASYLAINEAMNLVENGGVYPVPRHLQNVHADSAGQEREQGYLYAHDYPNHYVDQQYLPDDIKDKVFYHPTDNGREVQIKEYFDRIMKKRS